MRVALVSHNAQAGDAIGNQVAEKLRFFLARGADVRVMVESDQRLHPEVQRWCCVCPTLPPQGDCWEFLTSADLVIAEYGQHYGLLELLPLLAGGRPRLLVDYHGVTPPDGWGPTHGAALQKSAAWRGIVWCADAALVHSRFMADELCQSTGLPRERVFRLGHPVDTEFCRDSQPGRRLSDRLGLGPAQILLFVGRLAPNKRVPVLVQALAKLRERTPPVHAVVIGDTGDIYQAEAERCRRLAAELGVAERLHLLGHVDGQQLRDAYCSADVFVMPSVHEGFCIPVVEALASGMPVVAARAGALPETVGASGLTFTPDDADDLARQVGRILDRPATLTTGLSRSGDKRPAVAIVAFRYGTDFVGGAETSLRTMAETLHQDGCQVEVFTTCARDEGHWSNQYAEGTTSIGGLPVHRFRLDPHDRERHLESTRAILQAEGRVSPEVESEYVRHSIHSSRLIAALKQRLTEFDAILVSPYLHGLTFDVAQHFPAKTLLVPCFHDEPFAWLKLSRATYEQVGGIVYHSPEEQSFSETRLGLNHPGAVVAGTCVDLTAGHAQRGRAIVGTGRRYVSYCGRYSPQKGLPSLLEYAVRYTRSRPDRFTFVFMGEGPVRVPRESWARDLGFVPDDVKRDVLAGADLLIQLSPYESLSLVALEALVQGVPVLGNGQCAAVCGLIERSGGGRSVDSYEDFEAALDDLFHEPASWHEQGRQGQAYVRAHFGSRTALAAVLRQAIADLRRPLRERLIERGQERAALFHRPRWTDDFGELVERLLDRPARSVQSRLIVRPRTPELSAPVNEPLMLVAVQVCNEGTEPALPEGPARLVLRCRVIQEDGEVVSPDRETQLPSLVLPGQQIAGVVSVPLPGRPGSYRVLLWAGRLDQQESDGETEIILTVSDYLSGRSGGCATPLLAAVQAAIAEAHALQRLPDDYLDVTEGRLARLKRWLKRKVLHNFKRAYVDVLSQQQSAFNARVVSALHDLAESCATLDHATRLEQPPADMMAQRLAELEARVAQLEAERLENACRVAS